MSSDAVQSGPAGGCSEAPMSVRKSVGVVLWPLDEENQHRDAIIMRLGDDQTRLLPCKTWRMLLMMKLAASVSRLTCRKREWGVAEEKSAVTFCRLRQNDVFMLPIHCLHPKQPILQVLRL